MITGTPCAGNLVDSRLKELLPALPVVYVKAVPVQVCNTLSLNLVFSQRKIVKCQAIEAANLFLFIPDGEKAI